MCFAESFQSNYEKNDLFYLSIMVAIRRYNRSPSRTTWKTKPRNLNKIRSLCVCLRSTQVINGPAFGWRKRRAIGTHAAPNDHLIINQINCSHDYEPTDLDFSDCHSYTSESEWKRIQLPDPTIQHPTAINMFGSQNFVRKINKWMINKRVEQLKSIRLRKCTF